jgi:8-oxo-dGTP pyrophosphatase MutT (NUDIX family)
MDVVRSIHVRRGGSPEKRTPGQLLKRYLEVRGTPPDQADKLLAAAREVFEEA